MITQGEFGYKRVNVADQQRDPQSFLNWMEHLIRLRKECFEIGRGSIRILQTNDPGVLVHICSLGDAAILAMHSFVDKPASVRIDLSELSCDCLVGILGDLRHERVDVSLSIEIDGYGYRWFRMTGTGWKQV